MLHKQRACEIEHGTKLFLYNVQSKFLSGPFYAKGAPATYDAHAWGGRYPCQVEVEDVSSSSQVEVPSGKRGGLNAGYMSQSRHDRIAALLCVAPTAMVPYAGLSPVLCIKDKKKHTSQALKLLETFIDNIKSEYEEKLDAAENEKRELKKKLAKEKETVQKQKRVADQAAAEAAAAQSDLVQRNSQLREAANQSPFPLPYYWDGDHSGSGPKSQLRDAYAREGFNWKCAETMLNDYIHPCCKSEGTSCSDLFGETISSRIPPAPSLLKLNSHTTMPPYRGIEPKIFRRWPRSVSHRELATPRKPRSLPAV